MSYLVRVTRPATRDIERLPPSLARRVQRRLHELALAPTDPRLSKPLVDAAGLRSSRVGDWRILFRILPAPPGGSVPPDGAPLEGIIEIDAVRPRGRVYRNL